jgi:hypothetical protein
MRAPRTVVEFKGCWHSVKGDISGIADDAQQLTARNVGICHCFGETGRGNVYFAHTHGALRRGDISAEIGEATLRIYRLRLDCQQFSGPRNSCR